MVNGEANNMVQSDTADPSADRIERLLTELCGPAGEASRQGQGQKNLIATLQSIQGHFGYLPPECLSRLSRRTGVPLSRIYGVVSFYSQFYTAPRGRHTVRCCTGTACHVKGSSRIIETVERILGISPGQSTDDMMFCLETVACLGTCFLAPVVMIDDAYFGDLTPGKLETILDNYTDGLS